MSGAAESYFCTPDLVLISIAEVAHLVEHDLAKVGVAGSSPVFRSNLPSVIRDGIFFDPPALVVELVDTQDLKSCSPKKRVRVRFPPGARLHLKTLIVSTFKVFCFHGTFQGTRMLIFNF